VVIEAPHLDAFAKALFGAGFQRVGEASATPWNFLLARSNGPVVDVHVIVLDPDGNGVLGPPQEGNAYAAASLTGRGTLGGRAVECVAAEWVVRFHDAYTGDADDRADMRTLCDRFGLTAPEQYQQPSKTRLVVRRPSSVVGRPPSSGT
jgi:lincosamide nucleotidyltransferase A/C/D/E